MRTYGFKLIRIRNNLTLLLLFFSFLVNGQQEMFDVSGTVTSSEDNKPLPGVSVIIKGTSTGTITDLEGKYTIPNASVGSVLVFSFVGMVTEEIAVRNQSVIDLVMLPDIMSLEDVVVIGYGTARRSQVVGSVAEVKRDDLIKQPVLSGAQALQGKIPGVQIISSGDPSSEPKVRIRGTNTITANANPLYIVDGVIIGNINNISTNDIQSIVVLKDAASQAIYGSRAANGIILIETKSGKSGKMRINYESYAGFRTMTSKVEMADAQTYAAFTNEARAYDNQEPAFNLDTLQYNTNWFDEITRKGLVHNQSLSISGGTEKTTYYLSGNYYRDEGILKGSAYTRGIFRNSNEYRLTKFFTLGHNLNLSVSKSDIKPNEFDNAYRLGPVAPVKYPDGSYGYVGITNVANPVAALHYTNHYYNEVRFQGNIFAEVVPVSGLKLRSSFNFNRPDKNEIQYTPLYYVSSTQQTSNSTLKLTQSNSIFYTADNNITYNKLFLDWHEINLTVGYSAEHENGQTLIGERRDVPEEPNLWYLNLGDPNSQTNDNSGYIKQRASWYGRLTYTLLSRYNVSGVLRRDGSSLFPSDQKWGTFYSLGASWIISRENFMKSQNLFNVLKIRGGYGKIGNDNIPYETGILREVTTTGSYSFGGNNTPVSQGITFDQVKDATITWETTAGTDIGVEFIMLKGNLSGELAYYNKLTNAYIPTHITSTAGDADQTVISKAADVRNKGIEVMLQWNSQINSCFKYFTGFNITFNKNNVEAVKGDLQLKDGSLNNGHIVTYTVEGQPIGSFWVYQTKGIYQTQTEVDSSAHITGARPGDLILEDVNKDGLIDDNDRIFAGSYQPKIYFGINVGITWKQIDLTIDCYGNYGNKIFNGKKASRFGNEQIEAARAEDRWTPENPDGSQPRASNAIPKPSTYFVESGDFFRINNITIGYSIPASNWNIGISKFRIFATAQNPLIRTKYSGFTPELTSGNANAPATSAGIELGIYPVASTYLAGVNLTF